MRSSGVMRCEDLLEKLRAKDLQGTGDEGLSPQPLSFVPRSSRLSSLYPDAQQAMLVTELSTAILLDRNRSVGGDHRQSSSPKNF
jgi:hypothetical protein